MRLPPAGAAGHPFTRVDVAAGSDLVTHHTAGSDDYTVEGATRSDPPYFRTLIGLAM